MKPEAGYLRWSYHTWVQNFCLSRQDTLDRLLELTASVVSYSTGNYGHAWLLNQQCLKKGGGLEEACTVTQHINPPLAVLLTDMGTSWYPGWPISIQLCPWPGKAVEDGSSP